MVVSSRLVGVPVAAFGLLIAIIASTYPIGSAARMGPGFLPLWSGTGLVLLGIMIFLLDREPLEDDLSIRALIRPTALIFAALVVWGLAVQPLGLIPATFALVVISSFAQPKVPVVQTLILAAAVSGFGYFVFALGLRLRLTAFGAW